MISVCRPLIGEEECEAAIQVIRSRWLSTGAEARLFEEELSARFDAHVVAVSSASMGLQLALAAHGIGRGDEVIVPAITFVATSNVVVHLGARVVFADIDPRTGLLDWSDVSRRVTAKTRAIIPVDLYGQSVDLQPYVELASRVGNIAIIEDAAQAFGTSGVGSVPYVTTVFSYYATKNVAMGEGGAILTKDRGVADRVRILAQQGVTVDAYSRYHGADRYDVIEVGYKGNLPDLMAAIGRVQLKKETTMRHMRETICRRYRAALPARTIKWDRPTNYHLYPIFTRNRQRLRNELHRRGVGTGVHFECIPGLTAYRNLGFSEVDTPCASKYGREEVTLPTYAGLTDEEMETIIAAVNDVYADCEQ